MSDKPKTDLSKFKNTWFKVGANPVKLYLWYCAKELFIHSAFPCNGFRRFILCLFGAKIGKGVILKPHVIIKFPWNLTIGNNVWIGENVWIENQAQVTIEDNCCISQRAMLITGNHDYRKPTFDLIIGEIIMKEGAWLGADAKLCPGTIMQSHSIVTVGSVASGILEPYSIYQGNLAVKIKDRKMES
ncbi:MAG TPA: WcaF family extracellular polysaccharide biosynthesis acetyltransferase [Bacteroidia bacterium]|nr:WcaF family extracellular polysaccharide biosynthesis acetyltransferase [Bacteroidia bacterium]